MAEEDIKMNAFAPVTDCEYFYIELGNGGQGKIKKSELYNIFPSLNFLNGGHLGSNIDFNTIIKSGLFFFNSNINAPLANAKDWTVLVITNSMGDILQLTTEYAGGNTGLYIRQRRVGVGNSWSNWSSLFFTK